MAVLLLGAAPAVGDEPDPLLVAIRRAVADGRITNTRVLGFHRPQGAFNELPPRGAVLIGFDLGVGKFINIETVYALRAIYRTAQGERFYGDHGLFTDQTAGTKTIRSRVVRIVRVRARPGYAVGGLTVRSGLNLNGLSVTFMRINGTRLEPRQAYTSDWVGDRTGGSEAYVGGHGDPVVGLFGSQDPAHVMAVGLIFASTPDRVAARRPEAPPAEEPVGPPAAAAQVERPAEPPAQPALPTASRRWVPLAIFAAVAAPLFLVLLVSFGRKRPAPDRVPTGKNERADRSIGPPSVPQTANTAICERPGSRPAREPWSEDEDIPEVVPAPPRPEEGNSRLPPALPTIPTSAIMTLREQSGRLRGEPPSSPDDAIPVVFPASAQAGTDPRAEMPIVPPAEEPPPALPRRPRSEELPEVKPPRAAEAPPRIPRGAASDDLADLQPSAEVVALGPPDRVYKETAFLNALLEWPGPWFKALVPHPEWLVGGLGVGLAAAALLLFLAIAVVPWDAKRYVFLAGMGGSLAGGSLIFAAWQSTQHRTKFAYALYPQALACMQNGIWTVIPWDTVAEFRGHYALGTHASLVTRDGLELRLGEYVYFPARLYKEVERRLFPELLRRTLENIDTGKTVWFGPIGVSQEGLSYKGKAIPWHRIERIDLSSPGAGGLAGVGGLVGAMAALHVLLLISERGETATLFTARPRWCAELFPVLPNRAVLLKLLHTLRPEHVPMTVSKALGVFMPPVY